MFMRTTNLVVVLISLFTACSHLDKTSCYKVEEINGDAKIIKSGESKSLAVQSMLYGSDVIVVSDQANVKLSLYDGSIMFIGKNSSVTIENPVRSKEKCSLAALTLNNGTIYLIKQSNDSLISEVRTGSAVVSVSSGDALIAYNQEQSELSISVLFDSARVVSGKTSLLIPSCTHIDFLNNTSGELEPIAESELLEVRQWIPAVLIDVSLGKSGCSAQAPAIQNMPPEWVDLPYEICAAGKICIDTIKAADPEQGTVSYKLLLAPEGMTIGAESGIIRYFPAKRGAYHVSIVASDNDSMSTPVDYTLNVIEGLGVQLTAPAVASVNQTVKISAAPVKNTKTPGPYKYRFDFNGDGIFDLPADGKFGDVSSAEYQFKKGGDYKVKVDISDKSGSVASAMRTISVKSLPHAVLTVTPTSGPAGSDFLLDATGSYDNLGNSDSLAVRFDIDGDGKWDLPSEKGFLREKKVVWSWPNSGKYNVVIEVINRFGLSDTSRVNVIVSSGLKIDSIAAFDTVHVGDSIQFECHHSDQESGILKYEWSMDGDSLYEFESINPFISHEFINDGNYKILCRITDESGQSAAAQTQISVINAGAQVSAGGLYNVRINETVTLKGVAKDKDSRIVSYGWDLDGDWIIDTVSGTNSSISHKFTKSGKKVVHFVVSTDDGAKWKDSAIVNVTNKKPIARAGDDITSKNGKNVKLDGSGMDEDQNIIRYEWDFNNDGTFDWSSEKSGIVSHKFDRYSSAVLKVIDSDSEAVFDTVKIIICPDEMSLVENRKLCVDKYEYPGKKGSEPTVDLTFAEALKLCADQGKHLCTSDEWSGSCKQEKRDRYPYGRQYEKDRCNTIGNVYVKNKIAPSGEFSKCVNNAGVADMSGNAAEWVNNSEGDKAYVYGGSWQNGEDGAKCDSKVQLQKGRKYFYVGFRCCK